MEQEASTMATHNVHALFIFLHKEDSNLQTDWVAGRVRESRASLGILRLICENENFPEKAAVRIQTEHIKEETTARKNEAPEEERWQWVAQRTKTLRRLPSPGAEQSISYPPRGRKHADIQRRVFIKCSSDRKKSNSDCHKEDKSSEFPQ